MKIIMFIIFFILFIIIYDFTNIHKESFTPEIRGFINSNTRKIKNTIISGFQPLNNIVTQFHIY
jgi:hypothetical protein